MNNTLQGNITRLYLLTFCQSAMLITPVIVPLLQGKGLSMTEVMQTQALFALTVAICEVPSGYLADIWGRKPTLLLGSLLMAASFAWLTQSESFIDFLIYEFLIGTGVSLCSGADLALLYDTQAKLNRNANSHGGNHISRLISLEGLAGATAAIGASLLAAYSLEAVVLTQAVTSLAPIVICLGLVEVPRNIRIESHRDNALQIRDSLLYSPIVLWTAIAIIVFSMAALYAFWLYQKYWLAQGIPVAWFGYIWAGYCVTRSLGAGLGGVLEQKLGTRNMLLVIAVLPLVGFFGMATHSGWWGVCFGLAFQLGRGLSLVLFTDALNKRLAADFRATVNSLVSLGLRSGFIVTGPLLGLLVDNTGVNNSLLILGAVFTPVFAMVLLPLYGTIRRQQETTATEGR